MAPNSNEDAGHSGILPTQSEAASVPAIIAAVEEVLELEASLFRSSTINVQVFARSVAADKPGNAKARPGSDIVGRSVVKFISESLGSDTGECVTSSQSSIESSSTPSLKAASINFSSPLDVQREIAHGARQRLLNGDIAGIVLVLVAPGGQLYVTTKEHNSTQVALGLGQCHGCGAFFSHPRARGLKTHQLLSNTKSTTGQCIAAGLEREEREAKMAEEEREGQRKNTGTITTGIEAQGLDSNSSEVGGANIVNGSGDNSITEEDESGLVRRLAISSKHQAPWREAQRNSQLGQPLPQQLSFQDSPAASSEALDSTDHVSSSAFSALPNNASSSSSTSEQLPLGLAAARDGALATLQELAKGPGGTSKVTALVDKHGCGPLTWAAGSGHLACVQWLVRTCGCNPATPAKRNGRLPLHWASRNGHLAVIQWLVEGDQDYYDEFCSSEGTEIKMNCALKVEKETAFLERPTISLYQGMSPETPTSDGDTAFMLAAWQGHLHVCDWLVEKCGRSSKVAHAVNRWGCNAAFKAARMDGANSTLEVLKYVLDLGVDASLVNAARHSLLHKAAIYGRSDVCEYLLEGRLREEEEEEDGKESSEDESKESSSNDAAKFTSIFGTSPPLLSPPRIQSRMHRRPKAVGLPLGRAQVLPDLRNQTPSEMARYNGFPALEAYLRHQEDLLWHVPIVWQTRAIPMGD